MMKTKEKKSRSGVWVILVAAAVLEAISCTMYFTSRAAIRDEAKRRAQTELRKAELEIQLHTVEAETAAKSLALMVQKHLNQPQMIYEDTRMAVSAMRENTSLAVAFVPDYFPGQPFYEICSSKFSADSIFTRNIGSADHDYTDLEWYQCGFVHDSCWWCEPYYDDSGSQTMVVSCSHPVYDAQGKVVAVVCVDLSLDYLEALSENLQVYPNSSYSIRSSKGMDIVSLIDTTGRGKYNLFQEEIDATGWHIEIIIPEDELFKDLNRIGRIVGILMLLGLGLLIFIVWHAGRNNKRLLETTAKNQRMEDELQIANTIQNAMLPKVFPPVMDRLDLNIHGMVEPAKEIGGDLYDFYVRHDKLFFCIGDVSGKGVPAALVMAMTRSLFRSTSAHEEQPELIMHKMNSALADQNAQNMFLTLFLGVLDQQIQLHYNDRLFLYTDGLTEAENTAHALFGEERMMAELNDMSPRQLVEHMRACVETFRGGAEQSDDLTMMAIRYQTPALLMRNDIQQIPTLAEWLEGLGIPDELNMPMNLALEEAVTNVMLYAYPGGSGQVYVEFTPPMTFTITDSGVPFDPTKKEEVDTTLSAEERPIGGLGIHLVKQIMDEVIYERTEDKNVLTLVKNL